MVVGQVETEKNSSQNKNKKIRNYPLFKMAVFTENPFKQTSILYPWTMMWTISVLRRHHLHLKKQVFYHVRKITHFNPYRLEPWGVAKIVHGCACWTPKSWLSLLIFHPIMVHSDFIAVHRSMSDDASLSQQLCALRIYVRVTLVATQKTRVGRRPMQNDGSLNAPTQ